MRSAVARSRISCGELWYSLVAVQDTETRADALPDRKMDAAFAKSVSLSCAASSLRGRIRVVLA